MAAALQAQHDEEEAKATSMALVKKGDVDVPVAPVIVKSPKRQKRIVNKGPILLYVWLIFLIIMLVLSLL
jgi:hypothetical protein